MNILNEIYQFLFVSSITFMTYIVINLFIKIYGRFKLNNNTKFTLTKEEKISLWVSIAIFFTYLI